MKGELVKNMFKKQKRKRKVPKWLDHFVGSGEVEGELSSVAGEEIVDEIPGGDGGHSQEDEGSLADAESTSDTLAYGQKYVKSRNGKGRYQNGWIIMFGIVKNKRNIFNCMLGVKQI